MFCEPDSHLLTVKAKPEERAAEGIILGTPEYHGGFSGVLKNALDLMGFDEFEVKMMGLVGVEGGGMGVLDALSLNVDRFNSRLELNDS